MEELLDITLQIIVIPVVLMILKSLLGDEISYWLTMLYWYRNRPFDMDGNPNTLDWAMIYNAANGEWSKCGLTYHFSINKQKNGVLIHYIDKDVVQFIERVPFEVWNHMKKASIVDV